MTYSPSCTAVIFTLGGRYRTSQAKVQYLKHAEPSRLPCDTLHRLTAPHALISDCDPNFLSDFWRQLFLCLNTQFLTSTSYYPQTDGQFERTNQTVELAIRYSNTANPDLLRTAVLPSLTSCLGSVKNASTGVLPNEIIFGFSLNLDALSALSDLSGTESHGFP